MLDILTDGEREKFTDWLAQGLNPAIELLGVLNQFKLDSLVGITSVLEAVAKFHAGITSEIAAHLPKGVEVSPDDVMCFAIFCLQQAGATQFHHENLVKLGETFPSIRSVVMLGSAFTLLKENKILVEITEAEKQEIGTFQISIKSIEIINAINTLKNGCFHLNFCANNETLTNQLNQLTSAINAQIVKSPESIDVGILSLFEQVGVLFLEIASVDFAEKDKLVLLKQCSELLKTQNNLSEEVKQCFQEILQTSSSAVVDVNFARFATKYCAELNQSLENEALTPEISGSLSCLLPLLKDNFACLYEKGVNRSDIEEKIQITEVITAVHNLLSGKLSEDKLLHLIQTKTNACQAEIILHPLDMTLKNEDLVFSDKFKQKFKLLRNEIDFDIRSSSQTPLELEKLRGLVSRINAFSEVIGSLCITKEEKEIKLISLKKHMIENLAVLPPKVVNALEKVLGVAFTELLVGKLENTLSFFKNVPTDYKKFAQFNKEASREIKRNTARTKDEFNR